MKKKMYSTTHLFSSFKSFLDLPTISPSDKPSAPFATRYDIIKVSFSPDKKKVFELEN